MVQAEQSADGIRRNREIAARVRRLAEVIAQLAAEYEARSEPDTLSAIEDRAEELCRLTWELEKDLDGTG